MSTTKSKINQEAKRLIDKIKNEYKPEKILIKV